VDKKQGTFATFHHLIALYQQIKQSQTGKISMKSMT
jgi:hypothetical protein